MNKMYQLLLMFKESWEELLIIIQVETWLRMVDYGSSRKPKVRKKESEDVSMPPRPDPIEIQNGIVECFCEVVEELCSRVECLNEDQDEADAQPMSSTDLKMLVSEIMSIRAKKIMHLVPVDILVRLLNVLDHQIRFVEGEEDEEADVKFDSLSKKRRRFRSSKAKKSTGNKCAYH
ncbi:hypothetical protein IFM89_033973 [Coptis chinensis]|uniref:Uncharacterized protein n=1 Tax=Coptis chinensis TaxID=261450 RepID=A0A835HRJ5_9MAGN|nr:hypothetical protein IFM89_033973 [Coptis chinensis]